jgi:hypothetical protein
MTKLRQNQLVAIECAEADVCITMPFILAGGIYAEANRLAMIENMQRIYGGVWSARIIYHWRNHQHLTRWLARREKWRKSSLKDHKGRH